MRKHLLLPVLLFSAFLAHGQSIRDFADSIRVKHNIPELSFAVISSDSIYEIHALGYKKLSTQLKAELTDKFRIGSNTKLITGFLSVMMVKEGEIKWDTKFFDLFPELKEKSNPEYHHLTLLNLLSFRTKLIPYTYTYAEPKQGQFTGDESAQRYQFAQWFLRQPTVSSDSVNFSNLGYVAAGLMLEKVSGKPYKQLVTELGIDLGITFGFGQPNFTDTLQPWGHNENLAPEQPGDNFKLGWLLPAGNINVSLPDFAKFIQLQLQGLSGKSKVLTKEEFNFMHYGLRRFAIVWIPVIYDNNRQYSFHIGNPGTFLTKVYVFKDSDKAFILFTNAQTTAANEETNILFEELQRRYIVQ